MLQLIKVAETALNNDNFTEKSLNDRRKIIEQVLDTFASMVGEDVPVFE